MAKTIFIIASLILGFANPLNAQDRSLDAPLISELKTSDIQWQRFLSWWPGKYDNVRQVKQLEENRKDSEETNIRAMVLHIRRVELPAFGEEVYYAEWQRYGSPDEVSRQRIYAFEKEGSVFRLYLHIFPFDNSEFKKRTVGAYIDPLKLKGVTPDDMVGLQGCDVYFELSDNEFAGAMKKSSCNFPSPETGEPIYSWSQMRLQESSFQYLDGWFRQDHGVYLELSKHWVVFDKRAKVN